MQRILKYRFCRNHLGQALAVQGLSDENGATLVEFAIALTALFTWVFCFMELCLAFYTHNMISERAREGSRYAMVRGASCPTASNPTCEVTAAQVNTFVSNIALPDLDGGILSVDTTYPDSDELVGHRVQVKVTYNFRIAMPFVPKNAITMSSTSLAYIVQ